MTAPSIDTSGQDEAHSGSMRAITHNSYGGPEVLELGDVARPAPTEGRVLVKVAAASLNALDWHLLTGTPYFLRLMNGFARRSGPVSASTSPVWSRRSDRESRG